MIVLFTFKCEIVSWEGSALWDRYRLQKVKRPEQGNAKIDISAKYVITFCNHKNKSGVTFQKSKCFLRIRSVHFGFPAVPQCFSIWM